ncbi:MAG: hypothetical protein LBT05_14000 [Planctomycetaceae bacterium]|jgi:nicotinic acid mononucleotide adenylyltransferase|nr:hypothetical protein [Planctomycetaceae bacterium]
MSKNELLIRDIIHPSQLQLALAVTGGGAGAINELFATPGASQTALEAIVPYSEASLIEFLSHAPERFCSERTARRMAMTAFLRAKKLSQPFDEKTNAPQTSYVVGVGCTCSLASVRPKRGEHRVHWAVQSFRQTFAASVVLQKGTRSRQEEERLVTDLLITTIAAFADKSYQENDAASSGVLSEELQKLLRNDERVQIRGVWASQIEQEILFGNRRAYSFMPDDSPQNLDKFFAKNIQAKENPPQFLFSGSFDPIHRGHRRMIEILREKFGQDVKIALEIAVKNADKPPMDFIDVQDRRNGIAQMLSDKTIPVWLTQLPRFVDKAEFFHGVVFLVGADTLVRIGSPRYYSGGVSARDQAIQRIAEKQCRFLCFARKNDEGVIETADLLELPETLRRIVVGVPSNEFCDDISSTQLRFSKTPPD